MPLPRRRSLRLAGRVGWVRRLASMPLRWTERRGAEMQRLRLGGLRPIELLCCGWGQVEHKGCWLDSAAWTHFARLTPSMPGLGFAGGSEDGPLLRVCWTTFTAGEGQSARVRGCGEESDAVEAPQHNGYTRCLLYEERAGGSAAASAGAGATRRKPQGIQPDGDLEREYRQWKVPWW